METSAKTFKELTVSELYDLLHLRSKVFIVEQDCVYPDVDGKALHIIGKKEKKLLLMHAVLKQEIIYIKPLLAE